MITWLKTHILKLLIALGIVGVAVASFVANPEVPPLLSGPPPSVTINGSVINFPYTDENVGEDLIIYTDRETYNELSEVPVKFAVINQGQTQNVSVQVYTANSNRKVTQVYQLKKDVPYTIQVDDFGPEECEERDEYNGHDELTGNKIQYCFTHKIGSHEETRYRDEWQEKVTGNAKAQPAKGKDVKGHVTDKSLTVLIQAEETLYFTAIIDIDPNIGREEFFIEAVGDDNGYGLLDPWYDSSWGYKQTWTVQTAQVPGSQTKIPIIATTTQAVLKSTGNGGNVASSTAGDIVFTDWDEIKIDHEIERYVATTGELVAWVKVPFVSSTSTRAINIYYGNAAAAYQPTNESVWDSNFKGVWHLPDGTTLGALDSTSNNNDGTIGGTVAATGNIDGAGSFDGVDDNVDAGAGTSLDVGTGDYTVSAWIKAQDPTEGYGLITVSGANSSGDDGIWFSVNGASGILEVWVSFGVGYVVNGFAGTIDLIDNVWHYVTWVWDRDVGNKFYIDGTQDGSDAVTNSDNIPSVENFFIGDRVGLDASYKGLLDEVRTIGAARAANWIGTEYNNQQAVNEFFSFGAQEAFATFQSGLKVIIIDGEE